jgi:AcrR family transcriptional regulator
MTESAAASLTAQGQRTRSALVAAARKVFARRGYVAARINDVTEAADVSVGTFYTYFEAKEQVFADVMAGLYDELLDAMRSPSDAATRSTPNGRVRAICRAYLEAFRDEASLWAAIEEAALSAQPLRPMLWERRGACVTALADGLKRWRKDGVVSRRLQPDVAAFGLAAMAEQCAYQWFIFDAPPEFEEAVERLSMVAAQMLGIGEAAA